MSITDIYKRVEFFCNLFLQGIPLSNNIYGCHDTSLTLTHRPWLAILEIWVIHFVGLEIMMLENNTRKYVFSKNVPLKLDHSIKMMSTQSWTMTLNVVSKN